MKKHLFQAVSVAAAILSPVAFAAVTDMDSPIEEKLEEVVVTASFTPIELAQSGSAITVISANDIEESRAPMVSELLRNVPGIAVSRSGGLGTQTQVRMRGAEGNQVLVLINGVKVNDPGGADEFDWANLPAEGIERIEIIRGPQSTLWGSDAVAGVINIITKEAESAFQGSVFAETGKFRTRNGGFSIGSRGDNYRVNLQGSRIITDGINISRHGSEDDGYQNSTVNLTAGWQPLDNWSLSLSGRQAEGDEEYDDAPFPLYIPIDSDNKSEFRNRFVRVQSDLSLLDGHWQQRLAAEISRHKNEFFSNGSRNTSNETRQKRYFYLNSVNWDQQSQVLSLLLEREREDYSQRGTAFESFGSVYDPNQNRHRDSDSVALEYRITLWQNLTLAASARHDDNSEFDNANTNQFQFSYLLPETDTRLRGSYGKGIKNPTFTERFGYFTNFQGNPDLKPEKSTSWELGIDQGLFDGNLQLGLTYFKARLENEIDGFVYDPETFAFTAENKERDSHREGVELTLDAQLSDSLSASASYTYTDATQKDSATGRDIDEVRRPRHMASANLDWAATDKLQFLLNAQYSGTKKDTYYAGFNDVRRVELDKYTLLNLTSNYRMTPQLTLYARLENILDDNYEEVYGYQTPGFGGYVGIRYRFDQ